MNDCRDMRALLIDYAAGRLDRAARARVETHLEGCASCRDDAAVETALEDALDRRLPRYQAPAGFKRALEVRFLAAPLAGTRLHPRRRRWSRSRLPVG